MRSWNEDRVDRRRGSFNRASPPQRQLGEVRARYDNWLYRPCLWARGVGSKALLSHSLASSRKPLSERPPSSKMELCQRLHKIPASLFCFAWMYFLGLGLWRAVTGCGRPSREWRGGRWAHASLARGANTARALWISAHLARAAGYGGLGAGEDGAVSWVL